MSDERFIIEEVKVLSVEAIQNNETKGEEWIAVTDTEVLQSFCVRNEDEAEELCELLNELASENEQLREQNKKLRKTEKSWRKIHCCNKESDNCGIVQTLNAYLVEQGLAEDYIRWLKS